MFLWFCCWSFSQCMSSCNTSWTAINQRYWFWRVSCCHVGLIWISHTVHLNTVVSQSAGSVCWIKKGFNRHFAPPTSVYWNCFDAFIRLSSSDLVLVMLCDMHDNVIKQDNLPNMSVCLLCVVWMKEVVILILFASCYEVYLTNIDWHVLWGLCMDYKYINFT